jgi:hypothetical protein
MLGVWFARSLEQLAATGCYLRLESLRHLEARLQATQRLHHALLELELVKIKILALMGVGVQ